MFTIKKTFYNSVNHTWIKIFYLEYQERLFLCLRCTTLVMTYAGKLYNPTKCTQTFCLKGYFTIVYRRFVCAFVRLFMKITINFQKKSFAWFCCKVQAVLSAWVGILWHSLTNMNPFHKKFFNILLIFFSDLMLMNIDETKICTINHCHSKTDLLC